MKLGCIVAASLAISASASAAVPDQAAFARGQSDRQQWEAWFGHLEGDAKRGAEFWATERSKPAPRPCRAASSGNEAFEYSCREAIVRLDPIDLQRKSNPDYRRGWNTFAPPAPVASASTTPPAAPAPAVPATTPLAATPAPAAPTETPTPVTNPQPAIVIQAVAYAESAGYCRIGLFLRNDTPATLDQFSVAAEIKLPNRAVQGDDVAYFSWRFVDPGQEKVAQSSVSGNCFDPPSVTIREVSICKVASHYARDCGDFIVTEPRDRSRVNEANGVHPATLSKRLPVP